VTPGVVTPNIDAPISGRCSIAGTVACTMPAIAPAALVRIRAEIEFTPAMSTTEYIIVTSTAPTYGRVSPEARVETISFGTPTGSARMPVVTTDEPPEPPMPSTPSSLPSSCSCSSSAAAPRPMAVVAAPRSPASASASTSSPAAPATSAREMSGSTRGG
jgi:hypothetical protein